MLENLIKKILDIRRPEFIWLLLPKFQFRAKCPMRAASQGRGINTHHTNPNLSQNIHRMFCSAESQGAKENGFTLAEVLITLGIIGIVAALTIPILINNIQDQQYKTAYKKAYSVASQAWVKAVNDDLITARPSWGDGATRVSNFEGFMSEFKVTKKCLNDNAYNCWNKDGEYFYDGLPTLAAPAFVDASGMVWAVDADSSQNSVGAELLVDTNGDKKPNQFGLDRFGFEPNTIDPLNDNNVGLPIKIGLFKDIVSASDTNASYICHSYAKHPCYFTSWITGAK